MRGHQLKMNPGATSTLRRRLFTLVAVGSTAVALLATVLWIRGRFVADVWTSQRYNPAVGSLDSLQVNARNGWLTVSRTIMVLPEGISWTATDRTWVYEAGPHRPPEWPPPDAYGSMVVWHQELPPASSPLSLFSASVVGLRLMPVIVVSAVLPAMWVMHRIRRGRATGAGCCASCGYDLRASPERCPECGTARGAAAGMGE